MTGYTWNQVTRLLSSPDRQTLAGRLGTSPDPDALDAALTRPDFLRSRIAGLSAAGRDALSRLWLAGGQASADSVLRLEAALQVGLGELGQAGLLAELRIDYYHHVLALPLEVQQAAFAPLVAPRLDALVSGDAPAIEPLAPAPVWMTDLFRLLSFLRWQGGPLTQQGELYKRSKTALLSGFWPGQPGSPEDRYRVLLAMADWARLISIDRLGREIAVTTEAERFWHLSPAQRWEHWYTYWQHEVLGRIAHGQVVWDCLTGSPDFRPLDLDGLAELLAEGQLTAPMRARHAVQAVVAEGEALGWVERSGRRASVSAMAAAYIDGRHRPPAPSQAVVQPTGEVIVPVETPLDLVWDAEAALTLKKAGVVWTYRLDPEAIDRALSQDLTADEVLSRLAALSRAALPDNVVSEVQDSWRKIGRVRIFDTTIVWAATPGLADTAAHGLGDLVHERLGDHVLVLGPNAGEQAIRRLQKLGQLVRSEPERPGEGGRHLAEPPSRDYRYRPQVQASLPHVEASPAVHHPEDIEVLLAQAVRTRRTIRLSYHRGGFSDPVEAIVLPVALHGGVLHGVVQDHTRQSFQVPVTQILEAWWLA